MAVSVVMKKSKRNEMRIILPIKQVPETKSVKMDEKTGTVIREGVEAIVNPLDLYAIELGIRISDELGGETLAISMGPAKAGEALREALAMGVDDAVLVSDRAFSGSDTWATSYILSEAIKRVGKYDMIICGERATDGDTGQVGPGIAAWLGIPVLSYVNKLESADAAVCRVMRMTEHGHEVSRCGYPLLLTVVKEVSDPRLPTLRGKKRAKSAEIPVWDNSFLGLDSGSIGLNGSPTRVSKIFRPKVARECEKLFVSDEHSASLAAGRFVEFLDSKDLLSAV